MKVECPTCGQRFEMLGRQTACPNCGQLVQPAFQMPLPPRPRSKPADDYEELEMAPGPPQHPAQYQPPPPSKEIPAWVPATMLVGGAFIVIFLVVFWGSQKLASLAPAPPAPPPV